ncbi:MAG TPA: hypothetical protein VHZ07_00080 [Bryobacteraceae bacterium]|nr:hypothetical protein [Bryobacteraceae bacterium]
MQNISPGIVSANPIIETILPNRDAPLHLLAINHRPFHGMSVYLTQLWNHHPTIGADPTLLISMRYGGSRPFTASFLIPHCTCSTPPVWQLVQLFVLPPLFCVLLAFFIVLRRPGALHVWGMSALLLAISQADLLPHGASFQWTANTMAWADWFRIPGTVYRAFAQNIWAAALIVMASHLFPVRPAVRRWSQCLATVLLGWCLVQSLLALSWSEYYLPFVPIYDSLQHHRDELTAAALVLVAILCFLHNRMLGTVVLVLALVASSIPYWPAPSITTGRNVDLPRVVPVSGVPYQQIMLSVPAPVLSSAAVVPGFAAVTGLLVLAFELRRAKRLLSVSFLALLPPVLYYLGVLNGNVILVTSWSYLVFVLLCAGGGLLGICVQCLSTRPE